MHKKGFATIALLGLLVLVGVVGYFAWSKKAKKIESILPATSQADTSNWKTYTSSQLGFEVKYPENYYEFHKAGDSRIDVQSEDCKTLPLGGGSWPLDCQAYTIIVQPNKITAEGMDLANTSVDLAGFRAEKITTSEGMWDNMTQIIVQFQKGPDWYVQTFSFSQDKTKEAEITFERILSTFKFTEPTAKIDTSNWKTYTNTQYGFEFKYPATWLLAEKMNVNTYVISLVVPQNEAVLGFFVYLPTNIKESNINCPIDGKPYKNSVVHMNGLQQCINLVNTNGLNYTKSNYFLEGIKDKYIEGNFFTSKNSVTVQLARLNGNNAALTNNNEIFDQIFSTIRLIK